MHHDEGYMGHQTHASIGFSRPACSRTLFVQPECVALLLCDIDILVWNLTCHVEGVPEHALWRFGLVKACVAV